MNLLELSRHFLEIGIGIFIQSGCLIFLGLSAALLLRRRGPFFELAAHRATLICVVMSALMSIAIAGRVEPLWSVSIGNSQISAPFWSVSMRSVSDVDRTTFTASGPRDIERPKRKISLAALSLASAAIWRTPMIYAGLIAVYLMGAAAQLLWLGVCGIALRRFCLRGITVRDGPIAAMMSEIADRAGVKAPRVMVHPGVESPFLAGVFQPTVILPCNALERYGDAGTRAVLAHEFSHFLQRDCAWNLGFRLIAALFWPQALLPLVYRRWREAAEYTCDQWVLAHACPPRSYADCLLGIAENHTVSRSQRALAIGAAPFRTMIGKRLVRIAGWRCGKLVMLSRTGRFVLGCVVLVAASGVLFLVSTSAVAHPAHLSAHPEIPASAHPARREALSQGEHPMPKKHIALTAMLALTGSVIHASLPAVASPVFSTAHVKPISKPHAAPVPRSKPAPPAIQIAASAPIHMISGIKSAIVESAPVDNAPSKSLSGSSAGKAALSTPAANPPSNYRWYKVVLQNATCTDVMQKINGLDPNTPDAGVVKLTASINALPPDQSILIKATPEVFAAMRKLLEKFDVASNAPPPEQASAVANGSVSH